MFKLVFFFVLFLIGGSYLLHCQSSLPFALAWIGGFPGDMVYDLFGHRLYCPFTSAALSSFFCTVFFAVIS